MRNRYLLPHQTAGANHWIEILKLVTMCAVKHRILAAMAWHLSMRQGAEPLALNPTASCRLTATIAKVRFESVPVILFRSCSRTVF